MSKQNEIKRLMKLKGMFDKVKKENEKMEKLWSKACDMAEKLEKEGILICDLDDISSYTIADMCEGHEENVDRVLYDIKESIENIRSEE
jgi:hypothetical protein